MYCKNCGERIDDKAVICPMCGVPVDNRRATNLTGSADDRSSTGFAILGFFIPLIGLILYLVWKQDTPLKAKSAGKGALIGVIVNVIFYIIYAIIAAAAIKSIY